MHNKGMLFSQNICWDLTFTWGKHKRFISRVFAQDYCTQQEEMAHQCRDGPARGQRDRVYSTGPPAANFTSATDTASTTSTDSAASLGKVGFQTLDAQAYFSYDLDLAGKPEEWTCRNMLSDCVLQGPDSNKRTIVEIFNYEHKLGGQTVRIVIFIYQVI